MMLLDYLNEESIPVADCKAVFVVSDGQHVYMKNSARKESLEKQREWLGNLEGLAVQDPVVLKESFIYLATTIEQADALVQDTARSYKGRVSWSGHRFGDFIVVTVWKD
jgi:hypothetical protein